MRHSAHIAIISFFLLVLVGGLWRELGAAAPAFSPVDWEAATVEEMNAQRTVAGLGTLHQTYVLDLPARHHSVEMAHYGNLTHGALGREWAERGRAVNYPGTIAGEVIGYSEGGPADVVALWWDKDTHPSHYAIVSRPDINEIGCGAAQAANGWIYVTCIVGLVRQ